MDTLAAGTLLVAWMELRDRASSGMLLGNNKKKLFPYPVIRQLRSQT